MLYRERLFTCGVRVMTLLKFPSAQSQQTQLSLPAAEPSWIQNSISLWRCRFSSFSWLKRWGPAVHRIYGWKKLFKFYSRFYLTNKQILQCVQEETQLTAPQICTYNNSSSIYSDAWRAASLHKPRSKSAFNSWLVLLVPHSTWVFIMQTAPLHHGTEV